MIQTLFKVEDGKIVEIKGEFSKHYKIGDDFTFNKRNDLNPFFIRVTNSDKVPQLHRKIFINEDQYSDHSTPLVISPNEGQTLFRFHRGSLADAMRTVVEVKTREELEKLILEKDGEWLPKALQMRIEKYGEGIDTRINWDTHIVMWGHTVIGFLSGPLDN